MSYTTTAKEPTVNATLTEIVLTLSVKAAAAPTAEDLAWYYAQVDRTADDACDACASGTVTWTYEADTNAWNATCTNGCL